jgi:alkylation response protein AidB-like acyl-CoA dehydrogenase
MRAFVETELRPHAPEWEAARSFPSEVFTMLAARGWLGLKYGADADCVADAVLAEEFARCGSGGLADLGHPAADDLARAARDARLGPIGGGRDEIMKEILGKTLGL